MKTVRTIFEVGYSFWVMLGLGIISILDDLNIINIPTINAWSPTTRFIFSLVFFGYCLVCLILKYLIPDKGAK